MTHYMLELGLWILLTFFVGCMIGCILYRAGRPQGEPLTASGGKAASASQAALRSPVPDSADPGIPVTALQPAPAQPPAAPQPPAKAAKPAPHVAAPAAPQPRREAPAPKQHTFPATSRGPAAAYVAPKPPAKPAPVPAEKPAAKLADVLAAKPAEKPAPQPVAAPAKKAARKATASKAAPAKTSAAKAAPVKAAPAKSAAPAAKAKGPAQPKGIAKARGGKADNLQRLSGVGPKNEKVLHKLGFFHFDQIAAWTAAEIDWVDDHLKFGGRIRREEWVKQARLLAAGKDAEFAKLYGTGGMKNAAGETKSGTRTRRR